MAGRYRILRCPAQLIAALVSLALLVVACGAQGTPVPAPPEVAGPAAAATKEPVANWQFVPVEPQQMMATPQPAEQDIAEAWAPLRPDLVLPGVGVLIPGYDKMRGGVSMMDVKLKETLLATGVQINTARTVQAKEVSPDGKYFETISVAPVALVKDARMTPGSLTRGRIDFETPALDQDERRLINPYVDAATGVQFTAEPGGWGDEVVGLVRNRWTSACVDPPDENQKLGTGRAASQPDGSIGLSSFAIRATFAAPLAPPVTISAEFQTGADAPIRIRLFNTDGKESAYAIEKAGPADGTCGFPGDPRARMTLSATANERVAYAIMDLESGNKVFVIDNFEFSAAAASDGNITGMLVVETDMEGGLLPPGAYIQRSFVDGKSGAMLLVDATSGKEMLKVPLVAGQLIPGRLDMPETAGPVTLVIPGTKWCLNNSQGWWECYQCSFWERLLGEGMEQDVCLSYLQQ